MAVYGPYSGTVFTANWADIGNVTVADGNYATLSQTNTGPSEYLTIDLPALNLSGGGEWISGIKVNWKGYCSEAGVGATLDLLQFDGEFYNYIGSELLTIAAVDTNDYFGGTAAYFNADIYTFDSPTQFFLSPFNPPLPKTGTRIMYLDHVAVTIYTNGSTDPSGGGPLFRRRRSFRGG